MRPTRMFTAPLRFQRKYLPAWLLGVLCLFLAVGLSGQSAVVTPARVVAIGDVHGDYDALAAMLQRTGLLDAKLRWSGGHTVLVQTGDFLDRGPADRQVMDLLMRLEKEAPKKGGRVVVLNGNHEVMNVIGDLRYVSAATYASFADKGSEKRRQAAWKQYVSFQQAVAKEKGQPAPAVAPEMETAWMDAHPLGYFEHRDAFGSEGKYGRWLRSHRAVAQIGGSLFVHGGISPALASVGTENINQRIQAEVTAFDTFWQYFVERRLVLPFFNLDEVTQAAQAELERRKAEQTWKEAEAAAAGKRFTPDTEAQKHIGYLNDFLAYTAWYSIHPEGPLWFRGYAEWDDVDGAAQIEKILAACRAERLIVGHTPQRDGRIRVRFGGKVFLIDTGMLTSYYQGGRPSALEMNAGKFTAVYPDERVSLLDAAEARSASGSGSVPEAEEIELPGGGLDAWARPEQGSPASANAPLVRVWLGADGQPLPFKSDEEVMEFLRKARIVKVRNIPTGITHPRRVLLEKDGVQANAAFRVYEEEKTMARLADGRTEMFFRDTYVFDFAAYELTRMLGMNNVPPVVERRMLSEKGSVQIWLENAMTEMDRQKRNIPPPDSVRWNHQLYSVRIFDNLIHNTDRNMGNILIDRDWNLWLIDHSRAFRRNEELNFPGTILHCDRKMWERLQNLNSEEVRRRLKPFLRPVEISALLKRRDKIVELIRKLIAEKGEAEVLFDLD